MTTRQLLLADHVSAAGHNTKWDHFEICQQQQWKVDALLAVAFCILQNFEFLVPFLDPL